MSKVLVRNIETGKEFEMTEVGYKNLKTISIDRDKFELVTAAKPEAKEESSEEKPKRTRRKKKEDE